MAIDVASWLQQLGLAQYEPAFRDNEVDGDVLPELTAEDLIGLGVTLIGHRRKLLSAIAALGAAVPAATATPAEAHAAAEPHAERRQLTVMFCDLVGSTALSVRLDPEDMREVFSAYHRCCAKVIGRGGGFVAKYMGDGVLAYFGYPRADEHDAERAVRAALRLVEKVAGLDTVAAPLQVRVGIATGLVVVGDLIGQGASQEQAVVGETPNLAARLQALAEPGAVVIAPSTQRLTGGLFEYVDLGAVELRGLGAPVMAARVVRGSAAESRFEALHGRDLTPLVGREEELALLQRRWQQAKAGEGRVVVLIGEPGIGKSRLAQAMLEEPAGEPQTRLRYFCSPHHQASALHPFITQLEHAAGLRREDMPEARLAKLEALLARSNAGAEEIGFIAERMSIPTGDKYGLPDLTPQRRKEKTLEALLAQLARLAARQPVLMLFEDAHWIDPTSLELLTLTVARASTLPLLLLVTARPEFTPPWPAEAHVTMQSLARLGRREGMTLVERSAGGNALPAEILEQILARTDGVPLFLEELTKTIIESGLLREEDGHYALDGALPPLAIPTTLHDSLMARLDRLAPVREVAQIGAAIGREFSYPLLSAVAQQPDDRLKEALDRLVRAELMFGRGELPEAVYTFKHALVQEAAYASLLRERRRQLHGRIAEALEGEFPEVAETQPELVAHHYATAGLPAPAIDYYRRAAARAIAASANAEAIAHLTRGLDLIDSLPESSERISREIDFRLALGTPLTAIRGWGAVEAQAAYTRAKKLCAGAGDTPELFRSLVGLWNYHLVQPDMETASELSRELFNLAAKLGSDEFRLLAELAACSTCFWSGRYARVPSHAARVRVLNDPVRHRGPKIFTVDPAMAALAIESLALWALGYPDRASERGLAALSMDQAVAHPFSLCWALRLEAQLRIRRREPELTAARTKALLTVAREQGFANDCAAGSMLEIWRDAGVTGQCGDDRIEAFRSALAELRRTGGLLGLGMWHALFAECLEKQGNTDDAVTALEAAVVHFESRGSDATWEPEVHRLMGDLLLRGNPSAPDRAEVSYRRAIKRARSQEAKSWELRAATSLARLWRDQGKPAEARDLLAPIYGWFTEGFDTADLKDGKALLDHLA
jgi:class 3 adenylate cyclase/tetratricopeptide (TPR) repeat protein